MDTPKFSPAELDAEALQILREAEASINRRGGGERNPPGEIFLIALNSSSSK